MARVSPLSAFYAGVGCTWALAVTFCAIVLFIAHRRLRSEYQEGRAHGAALGKIDLLKEQLEKSNAKNLDARIRRF